MKYLDRSFSISGTSPTYRENWDRVFAKRTADVTAREYVTTCGDCQSTVVVVTDTEPPTREGIRCWFCQAKQLGGAIP